jgi:DNA-3-methyladenine glycosylase II
MFSLNRQDIFPADDLALLVALGRLKQPPEKPTPRLARELVANWSPWRTAGSLFLWQYYRGAPV